MSRPTASPSFVPWLLFGPMFLAAGVWIGRASSPADRPAVWRAPAAVGDGAARLATPVAMPSLAPIVEKVKRGVVGIRTLRRAGPEENAGRSAVELEAGSRGVVDGAGFIIHESGLAVTNHHLVADHERIEVEVPGYRPVRAELVGADPVTDIAVVRFAPPEVDLTVLELGDSTAIRQGDWVLAVGNPFQYQQTVTVGIVSYVGRHIPEEGLLVSNEYLQFSAPVNPGSSGGPVLDMRGNVVGVTTSTHATGRGISFAVPTKVLKWVLDEMDSPDGRVRRGFLGIGLEPLDDATCRSFGIDGGARVRHVEKGRPAHVAGVRSGDIVVGYNGRAVPDAYALFDWITYSEPGGPAVIDVVRAGVRVPPLLAQLGEVEYPAQDADADATAKSGPTQ